MQEPVGCSKWLLAMKAFEILRDSDNNYGKFESYTENDSQKMRVELNKMTEAF